MELGILDSQSEMCPSQLYWDLGKQKAGGGWLSTYSVLDTLHAIYLISATVLL